MVYNERELKNKWRRVLILLLLLIGQTVVIFYFSSQTASQSSSLSRFIMDKFDWLPKFIPREESTDEFMGVTLHYIIRKLAHMYNFSLIGCTIYAIRSHFDNKLFKDILWICLGVSIAILDEAYQNFVPGRSGNAIDVGFDFSGIIGGYSFVYVLFSIVFSKRCGLWERKTKEK